MQPVTSLTPGAVGRNRTGDLLHGAQVFCQPEILPHSTLPWTRTRNRLVNSEPRYHCASRVGAGESGSAASPRWTHGPLYPLGPGVRSATFLLGYIMYFWKTSFLRTSARITRATRLKCGLRGSRCTISPILAASARVRLPLR